VWHKTQEETAIPVNYSPGKNIVFLSQRDRSLQPQTSRNRKFSLSQKLWGKNFREMICEYSAMSGLMEIIFL
jgi:hypothetical protein